MATLRLYQEAEWVRYGECSCRGECQCTHFEVHRLNPKELRDLVEKHNKKRREKWPDGWREVSEVGDGFNPEYARLVIRNWKNIPGLDGQPLPFTPENFTLVETQTGLQFQEFLNDLMKTHQQDAQEIQKAELGNSNPG